jgi:hypothetical protein
MEHIIKLPLGAFTRSLEVKGRTTSWVAHERYQQCGENASTDIGKSQRLQKEGNDRNLNVEAMRPDLAMQIEKVIMSRDCERPETDIVIPGNVFCIDYADTWSTKRVH